jgi:hypothetical protein
MVFQDGPQPLPERGHLPGPIQGVIGLAVGLGQHVVEDKVVELLLAADVAVQRAGNHAQAGGENPRALPAGTPLAELSCCALMGR